MLCRYRFSRGRCLAVFRFTSGCFATVVTGLLSGRCFVAKSAMAVSLWRMLCHRYLFGPLLVDALLLRACWPTAWQILGRRGHLVFIGRCFATVFVGCSSIFSRWMLCHYCIFRFVGNHCVDVSFSCHVQLVGFWVEG
jgi:hypothetical protein